jgi:hypothetical protein
MGLRFLSLGDHRLRQHRGQLVGPDCDCEKLRSALRFADRMMDIHRVDRNRAGHAPGHGGDRRKDHSDDAANRSSHATR